MFVHQFIELLHFVHMYMYGFLNELLKALVCVLGNEKKNHALHLFILNLQLT